MLTEQKQLNALQNWFDNTDRDYPYKAIADVTEDGAIKRQALRFENKETAMAFFAQSNRFCILSYRNHSKQETKILKYRYGNSNN